MSPFLGPGVLKSWGFSSFVDCTVNYLLNSDFDLVFSDSDIL